jgi:hypothetical protein
MFKFVEPLLHDGNSSGDFHVFADINNKLLRLYEGGYSSRMQKDRVHGDSCYYADQKWAEIHHTIDLVFSIAPTSGQGLQDIHVSAKVKSEWNIGQDYEREFRTKMRMNLTLPKDQRIRVGTLRFNGATYVGDLTNKIDEIFAERSKISEKFIKHAQRVFPRQ